MYDPTLRNSILGTAHTSYTHNPTSVTVATAIGWLETISLNSGFTSDVWFDFYFSAASLAAATTPDFSVMLPAGSASAHSQVVLTFTNPYKFSQLSYVVSSSQTPGTAVLSGYGSVNASVVYRTGPGEA